MSDDQPTQPASDEPEPRRADAPGPDDATEPAATEPVDPDATQVARPVDPDATQVAQPVDPDATQVARPADPDATQVTPPVDPDATQVADGGATHVLRPSQPDPTSVMPPTTPSWRGQSGIPDRRSEPERSVGWDPEPSSRSWLMPVVIGIVGLLVLGAVAFGLVAALRNTSNPTPLPAPSPSTTAPSASTAPPSTAPPSSEPPSPSASGSGSSLVEVPSNLTGIVFTYAEEELNAFGLQYTLRAQIDTTVPANTVLSTNPAGGTLVPAGSSVEIVYAIAPTPSDSPSLSTSPPAAPSAS